VSLPRYLQISERLTREIAAGLRPDGARLPPELALARECGVAVGTLRKALAELAANGLLVRRQGSGNYVRRSAQPVGVYAFLHLELPGGGGMPGAENLEVAHDAAPAEVPWGGAWRIRRIRTLNGAPAALEEIWIDSRHTAALGPADLPETLYRHYAAAFGLWIARVEDRVGAARCPDWAPAAFPLPPGAVCGHVARRSESRERRLEEISSTWFDPGAAAYVARWHEDAR
jgi:GntR family transcriptional regulator